jgi:exodeoxyribonuclease-1
MTTFYWHDYETFGITPRSDRPAQFAGVRTDMDLNEIGEPTMIYCKPAADASLPSLESCLITGITPSACEANGISEQAFAEKIEHELAMPGTIGVGYNNIRFDDEVTRYLFWRNLIEPYAREWQNDCARWDFIYLVRAMYAFFPETMNWPRNGDGTISFKLSDLCAANGIKHESAHDALSDVRATIGLARLIKVLQPRLFEFAFSLRQKAEVQKQLLLDEKAPILHVSGQFGLARAFLAPMWPLGTHPTNKNEIIMWDLTQDPSVLLTLKADEIRERLFVRTEDLPDKVSRLPIKNISINKSPFVVCNLKVLKPHRAAEIDINWDLISKHAEIAKNLQLPNNLWVDVFQREKLESVDVDEDLYNGFVPNNDRAILNRLRYLTGAQLAAEKPRFTDSRLTELLFRYRARNFPESLNADEQQKWKSHCSTKFTEQLEPFIKDFKTWENVCKTDVQKNILNAVKGWVEARERDLKTVTNSTKRMSCI